MSTAPWQKLMPATKGKLAFDGNWIRTEASRSEPTPIAIMGAFPAQVVESMKPYTYRGKTIKVATACEQTSFEVGSKSGNDIDEYYLKNLRLKRDDVCFFDMYPYYLASPAMYKSLQMYAECKEDRVDIERQPSPQQLIKRARNEPGNCDRIRWIMDRCQPQLLLTLSHEVAPFVRGISYAAASKPCLLYQDPQWRDVLGRRVWVVHLAHPNSVSRIEAWRDRHLEWCAGPGRDLRQRALGNELPAGQSSSPGGL